MAMKNPMRFQHRGTFLRQHPHVSAVDHLWIPTNRCDHQIFRWVPDVYRISGGV